MRRLGHGATALALVCGGLAVVAASAGAATITVDTIDDDGTTTGDCELREAIDAANGNGATDGCDAGDLGPTRDVIEFAIGAQGSTQTITPVSNLPTLSDIVEIDGRNGDAGAAGPNVGIDAQSGTLAGLIFSVGTDGSFVHHLAVFDATSDGLRMLSDEVTAERLRVGVDLAGADQGNGDNGILVRGAGNVIRESVISANDDNGIRIDEDLSLSESTGTTIAGNRIGTTVPGTGDLGNDLDGISIVGSDNGMPVDTAIGGAADPTPAGACDGDCNVISGNGGQAVEVTVSVTGPQVLSGLAISGNYIGTGVAGTAPIGNSAEGIVLSGAISGALVDGNLIAANGGDGLRLVPAPGGNAPTGPSGSTIASNLIGVDGQGDADLGNAGSGIRLTSTLLDQDPIADNTIGGVADPTPGGPCDGACNVISGNGIDGIGLSSTGGGVTGNVVLGNHIGTDADGDDALGNTQWGVALSGAADTVLGSAAAPNVISGNELSGVLVLGDITGGNLIESNLIGRAANGSDPLGNVEHGVQVFAGATGARVGGTAPQSANTIADNGGAGVFVGGGADEIPILGNSIAGNGGLGIDLLPDLLTAGVTPNDGPGDADTGGGNEFQNFPELTAAVGGQSTLLRGSLESTASTRFRIEAYSNPGPDPSGHGEGQAALGSFEITTDAGGRADFTAEVDGTAAPGSAVSVTATALAGDGSPIRTSEFGPAVVEGCDLTGTPAGETLTGGAGDEVICGLGGDDVIDGAGGDDLILGGEGADTAGYEDATGAVVVDLAAGTATGAGVGADALTGIEGAIGSRFGDELAALASGSTLDGGDGGDDLSGGGGPDSLVGGSGNDDLAGAADDDVLKANGGRDELEAGAGEDTAKGGGGDRDDVRGQGGNDKVKGGGGKRDDVRGGGGKDKLDGGGGKKDKCGGGGGRDRRRAPGCETRRSIP
jgi:hypothetical protein